MKLRALPVIREKPEDYEAIERAILKLFREEIYLPLLKELGATKKILTNAYPDLIEAIVSGQIRYVGGHFEGAFNSTLSAELKRIGGKWDRTHGWWKVPRSLLSFEISSSISIGEERMKRKAERAAKRLDEIEPKKIADKLKIQKLLTSNLTRINRSFEDSVKSIGVQIKLTDHEKTRIAREYTNNLQLYIEDFARKEIQELRENVQKNVFKGNRYEGMIQTIQKSYGVSQNKAKFLARQETSLMMTKFKQARYEAAGVNEYRWQTVGGTEAHPVRPYHRALNGKVFRWDDPPIVDEKGNRKNPGQDYNCRCDAIPLVKF